MYELHVRVMLLECIVCVSVTSVVLHVSDMLSSAQMHTRPWTTYAEKVPGVTTHNGGML